MLVCDWNMSSLNTLELSKKIRESELDHFIYILTLCSRNILEEVVSSINDGIDDFISLPINLQELKARIDIGKRIIGLWRVEPEIRVIQSQ